MPWIGIAAWVIFLGLCVFGWWWLLIIVLAPILGYVLFYALIILYLYIGCIVNFGFKKGTFRLFEGDFEKYIELEKRLKRMKEAKNK